MRSLILRGLGAAFALAAFSAATTGCSASSSSSRTPASALGPVPPVHVTHVPTVVDSATLVYPIDTYLLTGDQTVAFDRATNVLEDRCMREFGFDYTAPPPNVLPGRTTDSNAPRRYGISDAAQVAKLGYHPPPKAPVGKKPALSSAGLMVLTGSAATDADPSAPPPSAYAGHAVPAGGCIGQARARLTAHGGEINADQVAEQINDESLALSEREPQVVTAIKQWSQCMAQHGYTYSMPYDAGNDRQWNTPQPTATEIRTAETDVSCKVQSNLVGIWYAVDSALQTRLIAANQQHLAQVKAGIAAETAAADRTLAAAS